MFWISPKDLTRFMSIAEYRHKLLIEGRKQRDEATKIEYSHRSDESIEWARIRLGCEDFHGWLCCLPYITGNTTGPHDSF